MGADYRYALSFTSQFPFCSVPLRLDAYSKCQFACRYCFAAARGGNRPVGNMQSASPDKLDRLLVAAKSGRGGVLGEILRAHIPIHFGGMADPFPRMEDDLGVALKLLKILAQHRYPTIVSAKGVPRDVGRYIDVLQAGRMMAQFSFTVVDPALTKRMDAGVPSVESRFAFMRGLAAAGVPVAMRLQPVFPGHEKHAEPLIRNGASAGARHVAVEFLKYPVEANWSGIARLAATGSGSVLKSFTDHGAKLIGREWNLPVSYRAPHALKMKTLARELGLTFAFADNDLLHFSDGDACCTAADIYLDAPGLGYNFHRAVKKACSDGTISFSSIENVWKPVGSVAQYLNSRSRTRGKTIEEQIVKGWNESIYAPNSFYGVRESDALDDLGRKIYMLDCELRETYGY